MIAANLSEPDDFEAWRTEARRLVALGTLPQDAAWSDGDGTADLFAEGAEQHFIVARRFAAHLEKEAIAQLSGIHPVCRFLALAFGEKTRGEEIESGGVEVARLRNDFAIAQGVESSGTLRG